MTSFEPVINALLMCCSSYIMYLAALVFHQVMQQQEGSCSPLLPVLIDQSGSEGALALFLKSVGNKASAFHGKRQTVSVGRPWRINIGSQAQGNPLLQLSGGTHGASSDDCQGKFLRQKLRLKFERRTNLDSQPHYSPCWTIPRGSLTRMLRETS